MKYVLVVALLAVSTAAFAQQGPDIQTNVITSLQAQRNNALDQAAVLNAQLTVTKKQLDDANATIATLRKQIDDTKKAAPPSDPPKETK